MELTYQDRAQRLSKIIEIAEAIIKTSNTLSEDLKSHMLQWGEQVKYMALYPEPKFKRVGSIKSLENDFLNYWNEATGPEVEMFWSTLNNNNIQLERKDIFKAILKRRKIKDLSEYDYVIDNIVICEQLRKINNEQVIELNKFLEDFEHRNAGKM